MSRDKFIAAINAAYATNQPSIYLGAGVFEGNIIGETKVNLPLRMMSRHGLVTWATGSAKQQKSTFEEVMTSPVARQVGKELVRGVFEMLFGSGSRRSRW